MPKEIEKDKKTKRIIFWSVGLVVLVLILISLIKLGSIFGFLIVFPWFVNKLAESGINIWLARALAVPVAVLIVIAFGLLLSVRKRRRRVGIVMMGVILILWFTAMFSIQKDYTFNPITGEPLKYYASTPYGYEEVPNTWKVHPVFGTPVSPATQELAVSEAIKERGLPIVSRIEATKDTAFFSPTGQPLVWYYQHPDGKIELFAQPGHHPQFNTVLNPINPEIVEVIFKYLDEGKTVSGSGYVPQLDALKKLQETLKKSRVKD